MAIYVLFTGLNSVVDYHFVGPFKTEMHAGCWAEKVHPEDWWFLIHLNDPGAEPPMVMSPLLEQAIPDGQSNYDFILCWNETSFHLIGPFAYFAAIKRYMKGVNGENVDDGLGPYLDLNWYRVQAGAAPRPPTVSAASPIVPIPPNMMGRKPRRICRSARMVLALEKYLTIPPTHRYS
jgi:hypothetical protein